MPWELDMVRGGAGRKGEGGGGREGGCGGGGVRPKAGFAPNSELNLDCVKGLEGSAPFGHTVAAGAGVGTLRSEYLT
jgi:hypothetical protein